MVFHVDGHEKDALLIQEDFDEPLSKEKLAIKKLTDANWEPVLSWLYSWTPFAGDFYSYRLGTLLSDKTFYEEVSIDWATTFG